MSSENPDELKEKATVLNHVAVAAFPEQHLAPWMSIHDKRTAALIVALKTTADIGIELDRRVWLDAHPNEPLPPDLEDKPTSQDSTPPRSPAPEGPGDDEDEDEEPEFSNDRVRGAAGMFGYCLKTLATHTHDIAPSVGGLGRRQAMALGMAQKSGVAVEPKPRSLWDKITGKNKDQNQASGGVNN